MSESFPHPRPAGPHLPSQGVRILVVEDHADTARALARLLAYHGHDVRVAQSQHEAMRVASGAEFDLVISDVGLPDGSGLELMRHLKLHYRLPGIALSGYGMEDDVLRSHDAGFDEHLTKPVDLERLTNVIERLAARRDDDAPPVTSVAVTAPASTAPRAP